MKGRDSYITRGWMRLALAFLSWLMTVLLYLEDCRSACGVGHYTSACHPLLAVITAAASHQPPVINHIPTLSHI
jgi:hypothetical protein